MPPWPLIPIPIAPGPSVNRRPLGQLPVSGAGGQNRQRWEDLTNERLDASPTSEIGRLLRCSSSISGPMVAAAGRLGVAKISHKMAPPVEQSFIARSVCWQTEWTEKRYIQCLVSITRRVMKQTTSAVKQKRVTGSRRVKREEGGGTDSEAPPLPLSPWLRLWTGPSY